MIALYNHQILADIQDRYATLTYLFDFVNKNEEAKELQFELTIEADAFISKFEADIDDQLFVSKTKKKK